MTMRIAADGAASVTHCQYRNARSDMLIRDESHRSGTRRRGCMQGEADRGDGAGLSEEMRAEMFSRSSADQGCDDGDAYSGIVQS
jgi:hypothetical protein